MESLNGGGLIAGLGAVSQRVSGMVELLATLDLRLTAALDALGEMQRSVAALEPVGASADRLIADARSQMGDLDVRLARLEDRLNNDLDEIKAAILAKIGELDLGKLGPRVDRLEEAIFNIERATTSFDQAIEGAMEMMPNFVSKRIKGEGKAHAPDPDLSGPTRR